MNKTVSILNIPLMKLGLYGKQNGFGLPETEVIATFGAAQVVRHLSGKIEIRGGTAADLAAARAWSDQFFPVTPPSPHKELTTKN